MQNENERAPREGPGGGWEVLEEFDWAADEVGQGAVRETLIALLATATFLPLPVRSERAGGVISVASEQRLVRHTATGGLRIRHAEVLEGDEAALLNWSAEHADMYLGRGARVVLTLSDGREIALEGGTGLRLLEAAALPVEPLAELPAFETDAAAIADDRWLDETLESHLGLDDAWHTAAAAGLYASYAPPPKTGEAVLRAVDSPPHRWIEGLNPEQRRTIELRLAARLDGLWHAMNRLEGDLSPNEATWREAFAEWCVERDEFEGVRQLVKWGRFGRDVLDAAAEFDRVASAFARSVPVAIVPDREQLRRAALVRPGAWWITVFPFYPDDESSEPDEPGASG